MDQEQRGQGLRAPQAQRLTARLVATCCPANPPGELLSYMTCMGRPCASASARPSVLLVTSTCTSPTRSSCGPHCGARDNRCVLGVPAGLRDQGLRW